MYEKIDIRKCIESNERVVIVVEPMEVDDGYDHKIDGVLASLMTFMELRGFENMDVDSEDILMAECESEERLILDALLVVVLHVVARAMQDVAV